MLYFNFKDYEDFKTIFGMRECGNGTKTRQNKILLGIFKDRNFFRWCLENKRDFLFCRSVANVKKLVYDILRGDTIWKNGCWTSRLKNGYTFPTVGIRTDERLGICYDGIPGYVRYINCDNNREYKMKAGKFFRKVIESSSLDGILPECACRWLEEDFSQEWTAYTQQFCKDYILHVGSERSDFARIYDSDYLVGDFHSCMTDKDQSDFYHDAVSAEAAWIEDENGDIFARCIIFTDVMDDRGNSYRLAERQYSSGLDDSLKRILVNKLIEAGKIDGYKQVGVDCHNSRAYVSNNGDDWSRKYFEIRCNLEDGDILSYQDSFKWFKPYESRAYNYAVDGAEGLDTTESAFSLNDNRCWSEYNNEYIYEEDAYYDSYRDDYFYGFQVVLDHWDNWRFKEDCVQCPVCGKWFSPEHDGYYSDVTDAHYCKESCMKSAEIEYKEENWTYAEFDDEYFEDEDDVTTMMRWYPWGWNEETVSVDRLDRLDTIEVNGIHYYENDEEALKLLAEHEETVAA